jgi:hypothetical protein
MEALMKNEWMTKILKLRKEQQAAVTFPATAN